MVSRRAFCWVTNWPAWSSSTAFEPGDALGLGLVGALAISASLGFKQGDGRGLGLAGLGLEGGFFGGEVFEQAAEAFRFLAAGFELVGADRAGARALADEAGALAVEFALELGLPEAQLGLEFGVLRGEFGDWVSMTARRSRNGAVPSFDGGLEFGLLLGGEAGDGGRRRPRYPGG
jgi:hypothetical protein